MAAKRPYVQLFSLHGLIRSKNLEMGRDADAVQVVEDVFGDAVVEHALAVNNLVLLVVEGGRVVLEVLNQGSRFGALVKDLALTFVNAPAAVHWLYRSVV